MPPSTNDRTVSVIVEKYKCSRAVKWQDRIIQPRFQSIPLVRKEMKYNILLENIVR